MFTSILLLFMSLFIYFGCIGSLLLSAGFLQLWRAGATLQLRCIGLLRWLLLLKSTGSRRTGFSSCDWLQGTWALVVAARGLQNRDSAVVAYGLSCSKACGIFPDLGLNRVPCTGRQIVTHCTTRKVQKQSGLVNLNFSPIVEPYTKK